MMCFVFIVVNNVIQIIQYAYTFNNNSVLEKVTFSLTTTRWKICQNGSWKNKNSQKMRTPTDVTFLLAFTINED